MVATRSCEEHDSSIENCQQCKRLRRTAKNRRKKLHRKHNRARRKQMENQPWHKHDAYVQAVQEEALNWSFEMPDFVQERVGMRGVNDWAFGRLIELKGNPDPLAEEPLLLDIVRLLEQQQIIDNEEDDDGESYYSNFSDWLHF